MTSIWQIMTRLFCCWNYICHCTKTFTVYLWRHVHVYFSETICHVPPSEIYYCKALNFLSVCISITQFTPHYFITFSCKTWLFPSFYYTFLFPISGLRQLDTETFALNVRNNHIVSYPMLFTHACNLHVYNPDTSSNWLLCARFGGGGGDCNVEVIHTKERGIQHNTWKYATEQWRIFNTSSPTWKQKKDSKEVWMRTFEDHMFKTQDTVPAWTNRTGR